MNAAHAPTTLARHGAVPLDQRWCRFSVWAPDTELVELVVDGEDPRPLGREHDGYHVAILEAAPGTRYRFALDGKGPFADPASRRQPEGVHGPSEVLAPPSWRQRDDPGARPWRGVPLAAQVICEVHVATFSSAGTFDGLAEQLEALAQAGYSVIELMPVASFPGTRNWGYDGVFPFAVQESYGGPERLCALIDAAHELGLAVMIDVVYNHLGPEGAVQEAFGPYLTDRYRTPWGKAVNVDGSGSDEVRRYFIEHARYLVGELGADGLRLDAVHEIPDASASPFLRELVAAVHAEGRRLNRTVSVIAESPANDPRLIADRALGGIGCDGVWNDDFHHALRTSFTRQGDRYFADYHGTADLAAALCSGFVLTGRASPSRGRRHGSPPRQPLGGERLVVFAQNHDQIGNSGFGERLSSELGLAAQFPLTAAVLLSGWVPLRFMGEEYGELAPFHFFIDHSDASLIEAVRTGRAAEIGELETTAPPDPKDEATFAACRLDRGLAGQGEHAALLAWQVELLGLRRSEPALGTLEPERSIAWSDSDQRVLVLLRRADPNLGAREVAVVLNCSPRPATVASPLLEGCGLDVLACRFAGGLEHGARLAPSPDGSSAFALGGYGVLVCGIRPPKGAHDHRQAPVATSISPPEPPLS